MNNLIVSTPSHIRSRTTTKKIMLDVIIALVPACVAAVIFFGFYSLAIIGIAVASAVATEFLYLFVAEKGWKNFRKFAASFFKKFDFTSIITGLILALILPPNVAWYIPFLGSIFGIAAVKMLFGGTGKNVVNPAATARVFLFMSFQIAMTTFSACAVGYISQSVGEIASGATALRSQLEGGGYPGLLDLFLGSGIEGSIGETCKAALLLGGVYLVVRRVIKWWQPCLYIGVTGLFSVALSGFDFSVFLPSILSGGLIFGAIFMATDYSTSPKSALGNAVYFTLLGLLTASLRIATQTEVVSFCIMLMNFAAVIIDKFIYPRPFGYHKIKKEKKEDGGK